MILDFDRVEAKIQQNNIPYFNTPLFKARVNRAKQHFDAETNEFKKVVAAGEIGRAVFNIKLISDTWCDTPIDHFNTYYDLLSHQCIDFDLRIHKDGKAGLSNPKVQQWLRNHMEAKTFLNMVYAFSRRVGRIEFNEFTAPSFVDSHYTKDPEAIKAKNETDPEKLDQYARSDNYAVLYFVAENPHTSPETLRYMALQKSSIPTAALNTTTFSVIVKNPNTPSDVKNFLYLQKGLNTTNGMLKDTLGQLEGLLEKGTELIPQIVLEDGSVRKFRWRLQEFHDWISYEFLKLEIVNVEFTKNTTKTPYNEGPWTISQPEDSLALALWAKRVKNCVRSREPSVHSGHSELFFVEKHGEPAYTVEISGPNRRNSIQQFQIEEIQKVGHGWGQTKDSNGEVHGLIARAMQAASK